MKKNQSDESLKYRQILEQLGLPVFQKDIEGRFTYVNSAYLELLEVDYKDVIGKTDINLFGKKFAENYRNADTGLFERFQKFNERTPLTLLEEIPKSRNGKLEILTIKTSKSVFLDESGNLGGVQGVFWCVDGDPKHTDFYYTTFDLLIDYIYVHDENGRILLLNRKAKSNLPTNCEHMLDIVAPCDHRKLEKLLSKKVPPKEPFTIKVQDKAGEIRTLEVLAKTQTIDIFLDKKVVVGVGRDVTEQHEVAERFRIVQQNLIRLEKEKTFHVIEEFLTHSFKAAINMARNNVELKITNLKSDLKINRKEMEELLIGLSAELLSSEEKVGGTIDRLRNLQSMPEPLCPRFVLGRARNIIARTTERHTVAGEEKRRIKEIDIGDRVMPRFEGDEIFVIDGLVNLLRNAKRHAVSSINFGAEVADNGLVHFWVNDDGPGFSDADMLILADPNQLREKSSRFEKVYETGVGLFSTYGVLVEHSKLDLRFVQKGGEGGGALVEIEAKAVYERASFDPYPAVLEAADSFIDYCNSRRYSVDGAGRDLVKVGESATILGDSAWAAWLFYKIYCFSKKYGDISCVNFSGGDIFFESALASFKEADVSKVVAIVPDPPQIKVASPHQVILMFETQK